MIERIAGIVVPIFLVVVVGYLYGRKHAPDMEAANRINMDVFTPFLILSVFASRPLNLGDYAPLALAGILVTLVPGIGAWLLARAMGVQWKTFVPPMMFRNSGNMGLPLFLFTFGEQYMPAAVILFIVENTLHFTVGMWMLNPGTRLLQVLRNPMILAAIGGLVIAGSGISLPDWLVRSLELLGDIAVPLMLFALGVRLVNLDLAGWRIGLVSAVAAPILGVIIAWPLAVGFGLSPVQQGMLILFGALPPAVLNYLVAERYNQQPEQVAAMVLFSNAASLVVMPLVLAWVLGGL
ncbi:AEC family transporter [Saccharospirillum salsuginis]|uniref:Membrane protein n=1 Tax=Saccharospirillum salsuginis TaxID=418750 RepID=A0A918KE44_9GAMM|nr:AEC family transporter [Saccharospirillum salsuginis]GGX59413.1 membrane protein [Saccharospirillum salsuginis]